jgi:hypothetical protein
MAMDGRCAPSPPVFPDCLEMNHMPSPSMEAALPDGSSTRRWAGPALLAFLAVLTTACAPAAPPEAPAPAEAPPTALEAVAAVAEERITADAVFEHIAFLASDEMLGRDTPSPELERAAEYLVDHFGALGLEPGGDEGTFIQRWPFQRFVMDREGSRVAFTAGGDERVLLYGEEYFAVPAPPMELDGRAVFAPNPQVAMGGLPGETAGSPLVVGLPDGLGPEFGMVIQTGMQMGASGVILVMDDETDAGEMYQIAGALEGGAAGQLPFPVLGIRHDVGSEILAGAGMSAEQVQGLTEAVVLEELHLSLAFAFREETTDVPNVVAILPGSDPMLAEEYVVLTAHFDHVGVGPADERGDTIYSGADDNASGTSALMQVAEAFAALPEAPARSILFLAVSGEEKGLLGSAHYAQNPTVPQGSMVANVNLDMVSRNAPDTVYAIGEEYTTLGQWVRELAEAHPELGMVAAPDPEPEEQAFLRSDHFSFVQQGIPALMLTTWLHDDYHQPSDTPDRVDPDKAARVARLAFLLAHRAATEPAPPVWTAEGEELLRELEGQMMPGG